MSTFPLPIEVQSALQPQQPAAPAPQVPLAANPDPGPAPDIAAPKVSGVDLLAQAFLTHLLQRTPPPPPQAQNPTQKGSFADKLATAVGNVGASFGDSAAATTNLPQGVGGIGGLSRTLAARTARQSQEQKDQFDKQQAIARDRQLTAMNNLNMSVAQKRLENESEEHQERVYSSNRTAVAARENSGYSVEHGVTEPELTQRMSTFKGADGEHWGDQYEAIPTGAIQVDGKSVQTFDIVQRNGDPIAPTDAERDFIKNNGGPDLPEGTKLTNPQLTSFRLAAQRTATARAQIEEATQHELDSSQKQILNGILAAPEVQHALSLHPEDRIAGVEGGLQAANAHVQHGQQLVAAAQQHGDPAAIKEAQDYLTQAQKEQKNLQTLATYGFTKEDIDSHEKQRHDREEESLKRQELSQKTLQNSGDPADAKSLGQMLVQGTMDPTQLSKRAKNYNGALIAANEYSLQTTGKPFDIAQASTDYKYANQKSTKDTLNMINGMTEKGGAIDIASQAASKLPKFDSQAVNSIFNATATQFGSNEATNFHTAMLGLADEYSKVMGGGVSSDTGRQQALDILKNSYSTGQLQGAINIMRQDIAARKRAIVGGNRYLQNEYGEKQPQQPQAQPAPQTHIFDSKAWAAANPGKDVNAAVAAAKQQGYEVR